MAQSAKPNVAAFFAGAGGLDLGFKQAGFNVTWANEYDKAIWSTYQRNFPKTFLDRRSIVSVEGGDIPNVAGFIGGPPCQSWSEAGALRGIQDERGQLFYEYVRLMEAKKPDFFLAENVSGILFDRHSKAFRNILKRFTKIGYNVSYGLVNASNYGVPQDRERVIIVGYRTDAENVFRMPEPRTTKVTLKDAIFDLRNTAKPAAHSQTAKGRLALPNHEYMTGGFSSMYMSRNRVRSWDEVSFTIQAGARHAPLHPGAPKMNKVDKDLFEFVRGSEEKYRRLSVREAARIQTFPDSHEFIYSRISDGYKMIGNAVPVTLAKVIGEAIYKDLLDMPRKRQKVSTSGEIYTFQELEAKEMTA